MNEIWDPLSEGMDRPFVQAIGVCHRAGDTSGRIVSMDATAQDDGDERTVHITLHKGTHAEEYVMTERSFRHTLDELNRLRAMMDTWGGIGSEVLG